MTVTHAHRQRIALWLAILLLGTLLLAIAFMFVEIGHHCTGLDCTVCETILYLQTLLKALTVLGLVLLAHKNALHFARAVAYHTSSQYAALTPVSMKVRMNN